MGLLSALSNAVSGLNVNKQNLDTLSQNISNANTPNYSNEVVNQQANFIDGQGAGVSIASIAREVNQFLTSEVQTQTSANSSASTLTSYYSQIQNFLGQPGAGNSIADQITSFFTAVQDLANNPSPSAETNVVDSATTLSTNMSNLASSLQGLRLQADSDINTAVNQVNSDLKTLFNTNGAIQQATATNQNTSGLLDTRDATLTDLAKYIDINPNYSGDGEVSLATTSGVNLLSTGSYSQLGFTPVSSVQNFISNQNMSPITVTLFSANGRAQGGVVNLATGGQSSTVTTTLTGGKIQALLSLRDSVLPNILNQLDQLSNSLVTQVNSITNTGTSYPPPNSYTGTTLISGNSTSTYTGNILISPMSSNGQPLASPYSDETNGAQSLNLDLGNLNYGNGAGVLSVDNIISAINQYFTPQNKVELGNLNNVQLQVAGNSTPDPTTGNLSFNFNLNNISGSSASFYVGGVTVANSGGMVIASSTASPPTVTTTQPAVSITNISTDSNNDGVVTLTAAAGSNLTVGETIYLNPQSSSVGGIAGSAFGGYYTITSVTGNTFTISDSAANSAFAQSVPVTTTALTQYATAPSGTTTSTQSNGVITANLGNPPPSSSSSPYFTVTATIGTIDSSGNLVTSQVTYRVGNGNSSTMNDLIGAQTANGSGTIVSPSSGQPLVTAELVNAQGQPLPVVNGGYGNQQGYLEIVASNSQNAVAFNQLNSAQQAYRGFNGTTINTNQGFGQYFGLNNLFNPNTPLTVSNPVTNSAINMSVESRFSANSGLIPTGQLSLGTQPASGSPNYTYQITSGDNTTTQALAGLSTTPESFSAVGGLPAASTTFSGYAGDIIANTSTNSTNATTNQNNTQALLNGFTQSAQSISGVNLDQELANTVIYQNAYSASARIISVVDQMFSALINAIPT